MGERLLRHDGLTTMARVVMPMMSVEASGNLGGLEMKTSRGRNVACRRSISANKATPAQLLHRAKFGRAAHYWSSLSDIDVARWRSLLPSEPDLKAAVIACYLRYPELPLPPPKPAPLVSLDVGFSSCNILWPTPGAQQLRLSPVVAINNTFLGAFFIAPLPYIGAYLHPRQMTLLSNTQLIENGIATRTLAHILCLRVRIDAISDPQGILAASWTIDITRNNLPYAITYPETSPP